MNKKIEKELKESIKYFEEKIAGYDVGKGIIHVIENLDIQISAYGNNFINLKNIASFSFLNNKDIKIEPYDKNNIKDIEKGIYSLNLNLTPSNQGDYIIIPIPQTTEEERQKIIKDVKKELENIKIKIRQIRHNFLKQLKELFVNKEISEDEKKKNEKKIEDIIKEYLNKVEKIEKEKEEELLPKK